MEFIIVFNIEFYIREIELDDNENLINVVYEKLIEFVKYSDLNIDVMERPYGGINYSRIESETELSDSLHGFTEEIYYRGLLLNAIKF